MARSSNLPSDLILALYQAAQDRSLLPSFLSGLARAFDSHVVGLRLHDAGHASGRYSLTVGLPIEDWVDLENRVEEHPWRRQGFAEMLQYGAGHSGTILPDAELRQTDFYRKVLKPMDVGYGMGIALAARPPDQLAVLSINRSCRAGMFGDRELRLAQELLPHFRSAYAIMRRLSWVETRASTLEDAMHRMQTGAMFVDVTGKVLYTNATAAEVLANSQGVFLDVRGALRCSSREAQQRLGRAFDQAARGVLVAPSRIVLRNTSGRLQLILIVSMLRDEARGLEPRTGPIAAVFIHVPTRAEQPESVLREAFAFTPAEARLAALLATGQEVARCADTLGVSLATVRTQLRSLFAKSGTQRQSGLVAALTFALRAR